MLDADIIKLNLKSDTQEQVISEIGKLMENRKFVKDTYIEAVKQREKIYPTGLPTQPIKVAIPHTDNSHVNDSAIGIGVLDKPVKFMMMGGTGEEINVEIVFLLAIKDSAKQIKVLKNLMEIFSKGDILKEIKEAPTKNDIIKILSKKLNIEEEK